MQAWRVHRNGEPGEVMRLEETDRPTPGDGQVLVEVRAANVNFPDALLCRGQYQVRPPLPFTPGVEVCGTTEDGRRVLATPVLPHGGFADFVVADEAALLPAPDALDDAEAAALHIGGPEKAAVARELGCDLVVDRRSEDIVAAVKEATGGRGADVVYDPVGGDAYAKSAKCVAFEGRILVVGFASGSIPAPALNHALVKNYSVVGLHWGLYNTKDPAAVRACHEELTELAEQGIVKPLISERVAMAGAADAVRRVAEGTSTGRIVVLPGGAR
nr:NADPH:quinone oxidoreductase family protein [Streptomyces californicus]